MNTNDPDLDKQSDLPAEVDCENALSVSANPLQHGTWTMSLHREGVWAEVEIFAGFSEAKESFSCYTTRYRALDHGGRHGQLKLIISSAFEEAEVVHIDSAIQDGKWHDLVYLNAVRTDFTFADLRFVFVYNRGIWWTWLTLDGDFRIHYEPSPPVVYPNPNFASSPILVSCSGVPGALVEIFRGEEKIGFEYVNADGSCIVPITVTSNVSTLSFKARQEYRHRYSKITEVFTTRRSKITFPENNSVLLVKDIVFTGTAAPDTQIKVVSDSNHYDDWGGGLPSP